MEQQETEKRVIRRVSRILIPLMFALYVLEYLDRVNLGVAALQMNSTVMRK